MLVSKFGPPKYIQLTVEEMGIFEFMNSPCRHCAGVVDKEDIRGGLAPVEKLTYKVFCSAFCWNKYLDSKGVECVCCRLPVKKFKLPPTQFFYRLAMRVSKQIKMYGDDQPTPSFSSAHG